MDVFLTTLFWFIIGGFAYRVRGGLLDGMVAEILGHPRIDPITGEPWGIPNNIIRAAWGVAVMFLVINGTQHLGYLLFLGFLAFTGALPGYWRAKFDQTIAENRNWKNWAILTLRGMFIMLPPALGATGVEIAIHYGYLPTYLVTNSLIVPLWCGVAAGAIFVPAYLAGRFFHHVWKEQGHSQWGEWILGGTILAVANLAFIF